MTACAAARALRASAECKTTPGGRRYALALLCAHWYECPDCYGKVEGNVKRKSTGVYPDNWSEIAVATKQAAGWCCVRCGEPHNPRTGHTLTVHHLDLNPANCEWWNIPALCQRCHLRIQGKVSMERFWMFEHTDWFKPYVAGYYAAQNGHPTDKQFVMDNLDMLLEYGRPKIGT